MEIFFFFFISDLEWIEKHEEQSETQLRALEAKIYTLKYVGFIIDDKLSEALLDEILYAFYKTFHDDYTVYFNSTEMQKLYSCLERAKQEYRISSKAGELLSQVLDRFVEGGSLKIDNKNDNQ